MKHQNLELKTTKVQAEDKNISIFLIPCTDKFLLHYSLRDEMNRYCLCIGPTSLCQPAPPPFYLCTAISRRFLLLAKFDNPSRPTHVTT